MKAKHTIVPGVQVSLDSEEGESLPCRVVDRVTLRGDDYAVLAPLDDEDSVMVFQIVEDDAGETLLPVEDDDVCEDVFDFFRAAFDDYTFCDAT